MSAEEEKGDECQGLDVIARSKIYDVLDRNKNEMTLPLEGVVYTNLLHCENSDLPSKETRQCVDDS